MLSVGSSHGKKRQWMFSTWIQRTEHIRFKQSTRRAHAAVLKITSTKRSIFYFRGVHSWSAQLIHVVSLHSETAVNIGYSCKMLTDDMTEVFIISGHTVQSVRQELRLVHVSGWRNFHVLTLSVDIFFLHEGGFVFSCHWVMEWIVLNVKKNKKKHMLKPPHCTAKDGWTPAFQRPQVQEMHWFKMDGWMSSMALCFITT